MSVSLSKGGNVNLSKEAPQLTKIDIGLGWDARSTDGVSFDLDAVMFMVTDGGKVASDNDFIFYGNLKSQDGSVVHNGDNLTGDGDGDDEVISVDLTKVGANVKSLVVAVTIHEAANRGQNFGMVSNAKIRIVDGVSSKELSFFDLGEDASTETAMVFGEVYRHNGDWKFKAIGQGFAGGLKPLALSYGVDV